MKKLFASAMLAGATTLSSVTLVPQMGHAQAAQTENLIWIQIEAHPTLRAAEDRVRAYAGQIDGVSGFRVGGNWYAVVLGPFTQQAADIQLRQLRAQGAIPRDSFLVRSRQLRQQFWPIGANALTQAPIETPIAPGPAPVETAAPVADPAADLGTELPMTLPDETKREAQASERLLTREERMDLQRALKFAGFYTSSIDGAYGKGTRRSMAAWQEARGYDVTGILTTKQRAAVTLERQSVLDSIGMAQYDDPRAGISIALPKAVVEFDRYEAPFAHFKTKDGSGAKVVLISQSGNQDTLFGLYDILQTLEIVPENGPRTRKDKEFTLEGEDANIVSHTYARLVDGTVKGFTLVWPKGDDKRRQMVLGEMQKSFASLGGEALADNAGLDAAVQDIDLISGLEIRRPDLSRSGFFVDEKGTILTTAAAVKSCSSITVNDEYTASVTARDDTLGLALLQTETPLAPMAVASFLTTDPRLNSDIAVSGFSYEGRLGSPSMTFGTLADLAGLQGQRDMSRLMVNAMAGDAGGPVLDAGGAVVGMLMARDTDSGRSLPADVSFARKSGSVAEFLAANGVTPTATDAMASMDPVDISAMAADLTVLVSCWN
ncbi:trypsin-like peptidase domain-containing protein [Aliiroseovarius lamellibrachiae]|uniref:trypsin-like peptidase domain-containing protein n=1 Tax=Aliiroseovarius lamellibrachiae TaxID=1924933 RepID=UPI001BE09D53|nr:trypsin-like peptidase domain-containing protein [Aliiroseovarius lamellibrachiae]MBT2129765.1 trypsin-like peptidase domain-containing protein [Aliiroseovarius lamellibrachiae]